MNFGELIKKFDLSISIEQIDPKKLRFDERARWKCRYGCSSYGKKSCPPNVPDFDECVRFVNSYTKAFLFRFKVKDKEDVKKAQNFMLEAEKFAAKPYAIAIFPGGCLLCDEPCSDQCTKARPSLSALCINSSQFDLAENEMVGILLVE